MSKEAEKLLISEFGWEVGIRITMVVMPNIIKDFEKTVGNSLAGIEVSEEYKFDDRDGSITLYGVRKTDGTVSVTALSVHGKKVNY